MEKTIKPVLMFACPDTKMIVVKVCHFWDYKPYSAGWQADPRLTDNTLVPDVDITGDSFEFPNTAAGERAALRKVAELYAAQL